jgi:hypothetical protein
MHSGFDQLDGARKANAAAATGDPGYFALQGGGHGNSIQ